VKIGQPATAASKFQDALDELKNGLADFARPVEEAIATLARIRALVPSIPEEMLTDSGTPEVRNTAASLRRNMRQQGEPTTRIAASLLRTERTLRDLIEKEG
jgi:hypothetical protein